MTPPPASVPGMTLHPSFANKGVTCSRCEAPAVIVGWWSEGCYCSPDKLQALCEQHAISAPNGELLTDLHHEHQIDMLATIATLRRELAEAKAAGQARLDFADETNRALQACIEGERNVKAELANARANEVRLREALQEIYDKPLRNEHESDAQLILQLGGIARLALAPGHTNGG